MPPAQRSLLPAPTTSTASTSSDDKTVDVSINAKTVYRLTLFSRSPDIDWTQAHRHQVARQFVDLPGPGRRDYRSGLDRPDDPIRSPRSAS
ncbi:hypothetical protein ACRAWD_29375 [Caulobacter segnis]